MSCSLANLAAAVCVEYVSVSINATTTTFWETSTVAGTELNYVQVPITAGGEGLASPGAGPCSVTGEGGGATETVTTKRVHDYGNGDENGGAGGGGNDSVAIGVGVGVGVGGGMMVVAVVAGLLWFRRRKKVVKASSGDDLPGYDSAEKRALGGEGGPPQELQDRGPVAEMAASTQISELPHDHKVVELQGAEQEKKPAMSPQELPGDLGQLK